MIRIGRFQASGLIRCPRFEKALPSRPGAEWWQSHVVEQGLPVLVRMAEPVLLAELAGKTGWDPGRLSIGYQNRSRRRIGHLVLRMLRTPGKISIRSLLFTSLSMWVVISDSQQFQ